MAINDIFKSLTVGGINSLDYGVYITGEAVYNAPEKRVEFISIPGRSGDLVIDNGVYENIEVKYPAGVFGDDQSDFASKIRAYRNALKSQSGYQRITDTYNPNEYRLGLFVDPFEVDVVQQSKAGEFDIVFNCQPYRFLTSGEAEVDIPLTSTSPEVDLINPTLFESSPLIETVGYGVLDISSSAGDYSITINDEDVGELSLASPFSTSTRLTNTSFSYSKHYEPNGLLIDNGDTITLESFVLTLVLYARSLYSLAPVGVSFPQGHALQNYTSHKFTLINDNTLQIDLTYGAQTFTKAVGAVNIDEFFTVRYTTTDSSQATLTKDASYQVRVGVFNSSDGTNDYLVCSVPQLPTQSDMQWRGIAFSCGELTADSTQSVLGNPTYIDLEIGEVYKFLAGSMIPLNRYVSLGSDLAVLGPGTNKIKPQNGEWTWESIKVIPRWRRL